MLFTLPHAASWSPDLGHDRDHGACTVRTLIAVLGLGQPLALALLRLLMCAGPLCWWAVWHWLSHLCTTYLETC